MSETLMTDATTNTDGATSQPATTDAAAAPANTAPADAGQQQQTSAADPAQDAANTAKGDGQEGEKGTQDTKPDVPEKYEFTMPENVKMDEAAVNAFSEFAKEAGLSQEAAQKMIDKMAPAMQARQAEQLNAVRESWGESSKTDKEFGGEKLNENLAVAKKAMDAFGTPELRTLLNESGLGNHPEIIRAFYRAGKSISEDRFVPSGQGGRAGGKDPASSLYPNQ